MAIRDGIRDEESTTFDAFFWKSGECDGIGGEQIAGQRYEERRDDVFAEEK